MEKENIPYEKSPYMKIEFDIRELEEFLKNIHMDKLITITFRDTLPLVLPSV